MHDMSKYQWVEAEAFARTSYPRESDYGSDAYKESLGSVAKSLVHHYAHNSHHPQYYLLKDEDIEDGQAYNRMCALDRIEMVCDWRAACRKHITGDIYKSIEINKERFGYTQDDYEWIKSLADEL